MLRQVQEQFCLRELVESSNPRILDLIQKQPNSNFSRRVTCKGDFCHFEESANLILVDIDFILVDTC